MRVYEFSKKYGVSSKDLLAQLNDAGFEVKSHMSILDDAAIAFLTKLLDKSAKNEKPAIKIIENIVQETPAPVKKEPEIIAKPEVHKQVQPDKRQPKEVSANNVRKPVPTNRIATRKEEVVIKPKELILKPQTVTAIADAAGRPVSEVILTLLRWGTLANKNTLLPEEVVARIAQQYNIPIVKPLPQKKVEERAVRPVAVEGTQLQERLPVVVVLGHVDHGKTSLLDFIRKTRVAAKEKGGITQHLGAYVAQTRLGNIVFLDTPGHEAFSKMRARGVKVADIAILVVAADDGVMPQTIEAIKHAKSMGVPILVAINKVDKVEPSRIEATRRDLAQHDLLPEEWGGDVVMIPISAKTGQGIEQLLEMIVLQAQLMELRADITSPAKGYILESKIEKGRGPVATLLCVHGQVAVGDYFIAGSTGGRVSSLVDSTGTRIAKVGPSIPVQVAGFESLPSAGDYFEVVTQNEYKAKLRILGNEPKKLAVARPLVTKDMIALIVKTDTDSSKEALLESIEKLSNKSQIGFTVIQAGIGDVSESDVILASNTGARIVTLHIKAEPNAASLAQQRSVIIDTYGIIYKLLESLEAFAKSKIAPTFMRKKVGEAEVRRVFDIKNVGVIAGCYVTEGYILRNGIVVGWRGSQKLGEGNITSLQREKRSVKQVNAGFECGFIVEGINDWQEGDRIEFFIEVPKEA